MTSKTSAFTTICALAVSAGLVPTLSVSSASAALVSISSSSTGLHIALNVAGIPIMVGPVFPASGAAPPPYDVTTSGSCSLPAVGLSAGMVIDTASSPLPPTETGTATSTVDAFSFAPAGGAIFDVTAKTISSTSSVNGTSPATGSTTIADLSLTIAGQTFTFPGSQTPPANDVLLAIAGLTVTLNQQIPDKTETEGITTNAIAIDFADFHVGSNAVNGAVDLGQSTASIAIIPEPATWAEMLVGFAGLLGFAAYRTSRRSAAITAAALPPERTRR
jgi:hypothetical protein